MLKLAVTAFSPTLTGQSSVTVVWFLPALLFQQNLHDLKFFLHDFTQE